MGWEDLGELDDEDIGRTCSLVGMVGRAYGEGRLEAGSGDCTHLGRVGTRYESVKGKDMSTASSHIVEGSFPFSRCYMRKQLEVSYA